jgi:predicted GIY-YIG superfamily endonuclease
MEKAPFVYIMASKRNGTLYTGVTSDLVKRVWEHREGRNIDSRHFVMCACHYVVPACRFAKARVPLSSGAISLPARRNP